VETAYELGWAELSNGDLLRDAENAGFEVLVTTDKGIRHQQNLVDRKLAIGVLSTNDWTRIRKWKSMVVERVLEIRSGAVLEIELPLH
jgi:hypothetical protein